MVIIHHPWVIQVHGAFLDLSKAFDSVCHKGLHYELKNSGVNGYIVDLIEPFLQNRRQKIVLNGRYSNWKFVKASVPQSSLLGLIFFLIYISDLHQKLISVAKLFAEDTLDC